MEYFLLKQHLTVEKDLNTYFLCVKRLNNKRLEPKFSTGCCKPDIYSSLQ